MGARKGIVGVIFSVLVLMSSITWAMNNSPRTGLCKTDISENRLVFEYEFEKPIFSKKSGYDTSKIKGLELYERPGEPMIPTQNIRVLIPYGKEVLKIHSEILQSKQISGIYKLEPGQESYPLNYKGKIKKTKPKESIYSSSERWPGIYCKNLGTQSKRGYKMCLIKVFPLQYIPSKGTVSYVKKMRIIVDLMDSSEKSAIRPTDSLKRMLKNDAENPTIINTYESSLSLSSKKKKSNIQSDKETESMFSDAGIDMMSLNWDSGDSNSPLNDSNCPYYGLTNNNKYKYIIITSDYIAEEANCIDPNYSFQSLCKSKWSQNISACIVTTDWIYANYDPNDYDPDNYNSNDPNDLNNRATSIRMFLIDAYNRWEAEYTLLGGTGSQNNPIIPVRWFYVESGETDPCNCNYIPCDMYYGCVEPSGCTFNYDGDNKYGESNDGVNGGEVDLLAEIYVGRAAVETPNEVINFVRKTLADDHNTLDLTYISMLGEEVWQANDGKEWMEEVREMFIYSDWTDFIDTSRNLYDDENGEWYRDDLLDLINTNDVNIPYTPSVFSHIGHGNWDAMSSRINRGSEADPFDVNYITDPCTRLTNTNYFFVYTQSCYPGAMDYNDCFAEEITTMANGAFAVVMNSRFGWAYSISKFNHEFWDAVLNESVNNYKMKELGRANQDSKEDNLYDIGSSYTRFTYYSQNLFGDPEKNVLELPAVHNITQDKLYSTIQESINDANEGDEIVVMPGIYQGSIDFGDVNIMIRSIEPNDWNVVERTVIDGTSNGVLISSNQDTNSVLKGFTIRSDGYGVWCYDASPIICNCIIENNDDYGVYCTNSAAPTILNNVIRSNKCGVLSTGSTSSKIKNNLIYDNEQGLRFMFVTSAEVRNNTIVNNAVAGIYKAMGTSPVISNCIIWDCNDDLYNCSATYSCIQDGDGNGVNGNISSDPCFVNTGANDFHILSTSPCINKGDPNNFYTGELDIDGQPRVIRQLADIGADEIAWVHNLSKDTWYGYIQEGINGANNGDEIVVNPGTYVEAIDFNVNCKVRCTDPNNWDIVSNTVIDCNGLYVLFGSGEDSNAMIKGFTITGGDYGIYLGNASRPVISNCIIRDNIFAGIKCTDSQTEPAIVNNIIRNNGQGVFCRSSAVPVIKNNLIYDNGTGIITQNSGSAVVRNNTIVHNTDYGIRTWWLGVAPVISNCIIWDCNDGLNGCTATYSCIQDSFDPNDPNFIGSISSDPCFVNADSNNFDLRFGSPCANGGDPNGDYTAELDLNGNARVVANGIVDMGAYETFRVYNSTQLKAYNYIQDAIDEADPEDEIIAYKNIFYEKINFKGKAVTLRCSDPNNWSTVAATVIDANGVGNSVEFSSGENNDSVLKGFTVRNSGGTVYMAGIYCNGSGPTVSNCIITDNWVLGIYCKNNASPNIINNIIRNTSEPFTPYSGIGILCYMSSLTAKNNLIYNNAHAGIQIVNSSSFEANLQGNTIVNNTSYGILNTFNNYNNLVIRNNILWDNNDDLYQCTATYSCIQDGGSGTGNISSDPCFADADANDFHLLSTSPCIDTGDPNGTYTGEFDIDLEDRLIDGDEDSNSIVDMGADEYKP
ncbi:MAG: right-handed parallel beta-helix repeat-containing protein [Phycisphaerae bacterium]|jgi:parallel beta-helix repeat protein